MSRRSGLLAALLFFGATSQAWALPGLALVQHVVNINAGTTNQVLVPVAATGTGNLLIVLGGAVPSTTTITGVTDTAGNTYVQVPSARATDSGSNQFTDVWYAKNSTGGVTQVTVTYSVTDANFKQAFVMEVSGADTTAPVDVVGLVNNGAATNPQSGGSVTTTNASDFVASVSLFAGGVTSLNAPFNLGAINNGNASAYYAAGSTGTYAPSWNGGGGTYASSTVAFKAAVHGFTTGVFTKPAGGGQQTIPHGLGQVPKALILWTSTWTVQTFGNSYWESIGFTDGTTSKSVATSSWDSAGATANSNTSRRIANKVLTIVQYGEVTQAEADLGGGAGCAITWDATNFCLNWTTNDGFNDGIHFIAIGGSDVSAKVLGWQMPTAANASWPVTGTGFQPTVVIHAHAGSTFTGAPPLSMANAIRGLGVMDFGFHEWSNTDFAVDNVATSDTQRGQQTNASIYAISNTLTVLKKANLVSMDANGFTMNFTTADANASQVVSLALVGVNAWAGNFLKVPSAPAFVAGQVNATKVGAVNSVATALPAASTTGNLIVATVNFDSPAATVSSVTDSNGNTYNLAVGPTNWNGGNNHTSTYYASNITGGATAITVTATLTGAATSFLEVYALEYAGVLQVSPLDQVSSAAGNGTAWNSGSKTTTQASELIYGFGAGAAITAVKGASYTQRSAFDNNIAEDKNVGATGSYSADGTFGSADNWVAQMATFKAAVSQQSIAGLGFQPSAVLLSSVQNTAQGAGAPITQSRFGFGASDGVTGGALALVDRNGVTAQFVRSIDKTSKVFVKVNNNTPTIDAEADLTSLDANGFTLNWTTNDAVRTEMLYLGLANLVVTEVKLISFNATRYNRGVLLEWKTGYEINNLGFNLYREINGVRTKVNSSLVAGSGLLAGKGTAVNAVEAYARWDLDAAATSGSPVYWLEDLDFNGTSTLHGPITPVAGVLNAPEPTATQSSDLSGLGKSTKARQVFVWHNGDPEERRDGRRGAAPVQSALDTQWALARQTPVKIGIRRPGWYRVPQADLVAAGLDPRVDSRTLRLFVDGAEQAMRVTGRADGRFTAGDAIEFYATGLDTPYTDTRVYWLAAGDQRGRRIEVTGSAVGGAGADRPGPVSFLSTVRRKDRSIYFAALKNGDKENWFGPLVSTDPTDLTLTVDNIDRAAPGPAQLEVTLQGVTSAPDVHPNHRVGVLVNGTDVGEMTFDGQANAVQSFAVPVNVLLDGDNTVTLTARGGDADWSLVDVLGLSYWHTYRADADRLRATVDGPGPVTIGGFASPAIRVVDVTDPAAARELRGAVRAEAGGFSSVTVRASGNGPRTLLAFSDLTIAAPAFVQANHPSNWHAASQAHDYVVISHANFVEQVKPLAELREQQGHHAAVVDVEDVYDEFSFGEKTPQAIKDFLQSARATWKQAPRFVVLVGDATIDPRDYAGFGDADFVPTKQVPMTGVALETASDDWFVDFNGDGLPDVPIGRLSVRNADQAEAMVGKIVRYDQNSLQPWTKDVLLVADQNDDSSNFEQYSATLSALLPPDYTAHEVFHGVLGGDVAHQTLIDRVNDGQLLVNYAGHGSVRIWGSDGDLLTTDDVTTSWRNDTRLPFVVAMNCLNGLFDQIWDEESLAEALLRAPHGGAVAAWASSSLTPAATQALVNQELFRLIFRGAYATLGEAVAAAKRVVASPDLRRSWIFFGDPAMHLIGTPQPVSTRSQPSPIPASPTPAGGTTSAADPDQAATTASAAATLAARPEPVRLADFNADGRADVLVYAATSGRWVAAFDDAAGISFRAGQWDPAWQLVAADLNGDGRADLVFYKPDTGEWVQALTTTTGTSASTRGTLPGGAVPHAQLRVGDFNGDHRDDLLIYDPDTGAWTVALSDGHGGFTSRRGTWPAGLRVSVADFNGDSFADVFGYDVKTGRGVLALTTRDGQFRATTTDWGTGWRVTVANLDGNASADLLFYNPASGAWQEAFSDGSGRFATRTGAWAPGLEVHPTDLDGDGRDDVFAYNPTTGQWLTALNVSPGRFTVTSGVWTPGWAVATGDVNGDGRGDVVLYDPVTGVWFQSVTVGPGVFTYVSGNWLPGASLIGRPR